MTRDFRLVWLGQTASSLGNGVSQLAYPLVVLALTGSPAAAGALAAVRAVPYLVLGLPAGALSTGGTASGPWCCATSVGR